MVPPDKFVEAALKNRKQAEEMLSRYPEIAQASLYSALVVGDSARAGDVPAMERGGPRGWQPLLYICFSRFADPSSGRADDLTQAARILVSRGADPNASWVDERWPDTPQSCLYGATGVNNNPALARVLLEAGARPDDGESLYHSTEHKDFACLRLLLESGASPRATNALKHMLDREAPQGLRILLNAGADPNERNHRGETALHWAVARGRSVEIVTTLLDAGAAIDARREDGRTAYALAVRSGQSETAALLKARGADPAIAELDQLLGSAAAGHPMPVRLPAEYHRLLPEFASSHCTAAVRALLAAGVPVDTPGDSGGTALHWACWKGDADLVRILLAAGASLTVEDGVFHAPPAGWLDHGRENCGEDGDYAEVARLLEI